MNANILVPAKGAPTMPLLLVPRRPTAREVAAHLTAFQRRLVCGCPTLRTVPWHPITPYYRGEALVLMQPPFAMLEPMPGAPSAYRLTPLGQEVAALCRASAMPMEHQRRLV